MAYVDPTYNTNYIVSLVGSVNAGLALGTESANSGGTSTYSGTTTGSINGAYVFPQFFKPTLVTNIKVKIVTQPGGGVTNQKFVFLNGTSTVGSLVVGTHTSGEWLDVTMATATVGSTGLGTNGAAFTSTNGQMTMVVTNTNTATASTLGTYAIYAEAHDLFVT
jgi:hypothetical protein